MRTASPRCWARASRCGCRRCDGVNPSIHASAVLVGARAVLIRGPAGSGKSRLALALLNAAEAGPPAVRAARGRRPRPCRSRARTAAGASGPGAGGPDRGPRARHPPPAARAPGRGRPGGRPRPAGRRTAARTGPNTKPESRESPCRGLPSQPAPIPCPWCWPICNPPDGPALIVAVREAWKSPQTHIYAGLRRAVETTGMAVYCNAATHYNRTPSP